MVREGQLEKAGLLFQDETLPALKKVKQLLNQAIDAEAQLQKAAEDAMKIYATQTQPSLEKVQELIEKIRDEARGHIATDQTVLAAAEGVRFRVIIISLGTLVLGIVLAVFLTKAMTRPLINASTAMNTVASGDFTIQLDEHDVRRKDELGMMLASLQGMSNNLSYTVREVMMASVQVAASASQMSNGNQELNIPHATTGHRCATDGRGLGANDQLREKYGKQLKPRPTSLASSAADLARRGGGVLESTVVAMNEVSKSSKKISEIITIVNEIAFQDQFAGPQRRGRGGAGRRRGQGVCSGGRRGAQSGR